NDLYILATRFYDCTLFFLFHPLDDPSRRNVLEIPSDPSSRVPQLVSFIPSYFPFTRQHLRLYSLELDDPEFYVATHFPHLVFPSISSHLITTGHAIYFVSLF